jgi:glycosyltransferase involved in cell wall biosynthesis
MFLNTSLIVGGAETLLVNLARRMDRNHFLPEITCLKQLGPLGEMLAEEMPAHDKLLKSKFDLRVFPRLVGLLRSRRIDAVVTVNTGDKMFWGRLAARRAGVPVVLSAIHSTGWPNAIGPLNRLLTPWTDAFIAVAEPHGKYLVDVEGFPPSKVRVIPNGVDVERFAAGAARDAMRKTWGVDDSTPVIGIVAALRPEKDHELFLRVAARVRQRSTTARFVIVGDGDLRGRLESVARELGLAEAVSFLGNRSDIPAVVAGMDVFLLTSKIEANPVSILEAMAAGKPVVAPNVGSVPESVADGQTGFLFPVGDERLAADRVLQIISNPVEAAAMGVAGAGAVRERWSLDVMVRGYERLITEIYESKRLAPRGGKLPALHRSARAVAPTER